MMSRAWCLVLVCCTLSCSCEDVDFQPGDEGQMSCVEKGDCIHDTYMQYSVAELRELVVSSLPPPINALLVALVGVALYLATRMRDHSSLPWRLYQYRSKVFIVNQDGGSSSLRDVELLRMRLDEIERERDELRAVLDNKRLTEKHSEVDLASNTWQETVNNLQRNTPLVCSSRSEYRNVSATVCTGVHRNSSSGKTVATKKHGRVLKAPSLPSKDRLCNSHIPMPCRGVAQQVFSSADYARKCREMLSKLNESEKRIAQLTEEIESARKLRDEFELIAEQRNVMGRKITALTREKKETAKQVITLQLDIKTVREQFDDVRRQHAALTRQFDQLNMNAKAMAKDKRLLNRQLGEAKEELVLARAKLDGIHLEKSRLVDTIERLDPTSHASLRSAQTQPPKSNNEVVYKASNPQRLPSRNRSTNGKQKIIISTNTNEARMSSQSLIKITHSRMNETSTSRNNTSILSPKSSVEVIHKLAKSLEDKCQEFVKQKSYVKDLREVEKSTKPASKTRLKSTQGGDPQKETKDSATRKTMTTSKSEDKRSSDEKTREGNRTQPVTRKSSKPHSASSRSKKGKINAKELVTKSSVDITEFARSLQKLERNVEINMKVRAATDTIVYPMPMEVAALTSTSRRQQQEMKAVRELYHSKRSSWDSLTQVTTTQDSPCDVTVSDTDTSGVSALREEYTSESEQEMVLGRSARGMRESFSICCMDSLCSVCSAPDCQLEHKSCSDINCLATCSSCSLPVELSQSIVSYDDDDDEVDVLVPPPPLLDDAADDSREGLASIFGHGPVGEGGPWNLPGMSGIMTRTTRPTGSVLACQGSLGEVGDVTSSNELVELDVGDSLPTPSAKKGLSCFTANEEDAKRTVSASPAFRQFLQELSTLVQGTEAAIGADTVDATQHNNTPREPGETPLLEERKQSATGAASYDVFEDSHDSLDNSYSHTSTQYFVNNEKEPIF